MSRYRDSLRSSVAASAAPYGYTLTVWSSGAVSIDVLGKPHIFQVLVFVAGGIAAFVTLEVIAYRGVRILRTDEEAPTVSVLGNAHLASAGLAVLLVWVAVHIVSSDAGWPLAGFLATATYLLLNALQVTLAEALAKRRNG